ncbi:MAG: SagB/ThcOx family dehydrogenase [Methanosarcinaceae archaeon]|nr:SagB/ThcOx family dehydrogenase [Methanosarcinaceae archaeon]
MLKEIKLPEPEVSGNSTIEEILAKRRSVRSYSDTTLSLKDMSQLLWAAQGVTSDIGFRTAPSAGALYPLEVYLVAGNVDGLNSGVYQYLPDSHSVVPIIEGDIREEMSSAALSQLHIRDCAASIVFAANHLRITLKYGERGIRYVNIEIGHAAQNVCLQGVALGIGTCAVGAFDDEKIGQVLNLPDGERALYMLSLGYV